MARARLIGVELISMLLLGFSLGIVIFMYWNAKKELAALHQDNAELSTKTRDAESKAKTFEYKRNLVQSDLEQLQANLRTKEKTLTGRVSELQEQLVSASSEYFCGLYLWRLVGCACVQLLQSAWLADQQQAHVVQYQYYTR